MARAVNVNRGDVDTLPRELPRARSAERWPTATLRVCFEAAASAPPCGCARMAARAALEPAAAAYHSSLA